MAKILQVVSIHSLAKTKVASDANINYDDACLLFDRLQEIGFIRFERPKYITTLHITDDGIEALFLYQMIINVYNLRKIPALLTTN